MKKTVFMGTPEYAKEILNALIEDNNFEVSLVLTQPDRPVGRKKVLTPPPVKLLALEHNIEVLQPQTLKDEKVVRKIKEQEPDFIIVAAYGLLLPKKVLDIAPCINLHASLLPKYRGASPIQECFLNDEKLSGVTAMLMDEGLDSGDILAFSVIKTHSANNKEAMMSALAKRAAKLTLHVLKKWDKINPIKQIDARSSKCSKIKKEDGLVNLDSAKELFNKYRAFYGWPGVFLENNVKLFDIELIDETSCNKAGRIEALENEAIIVACKKGKIKIGSIQPPSKKKISAKAYLAGKRLKVGDTLF